MNRKMNRWVNSPALYATAALMTLSIGCATVPSALEQARQNYQQMQQDPQVSTQAPVASYEATQAMSRTEQAWKEDKDEKEVTHLAYLTNKRIEIARETAQEKTAEAEAQALKQEREKFLLKVALKRPSERNNSPHPEHARRS